MLLAYVLAFREDELRADLQEHYGIDLDFAMAGGHTAKHIAALVAQMPAGARIRICENDDERWTLETSMLAAIFNQINALIFMFGAKKGDKRPQLVGPSWMVSDSGKKVDAMVMTIDELREVLARPRRSKE